MSDTASVKKNPADEKDAPSKENLASSSNSSNLDTKAKKSSGIVAAGAFQIDSGAVLKDFSYGDVLAYKASHKKATEPFFALVSQPHLVPRHNKISAYEGIINPNLAKIVFTGIVYWTPAKQERFVIIYHDNMGKRMIDPDQEQAKGLKSDLVNEKILKPFAGILQDFRDKDFSHGLINANNLYDGGSSNFNSIVLGDGFITPSGYRQDIVYEPIERAMCDPICRGPGTFSSDLYSFGVMLAVLMRHKDPMKGLSDDEIIRRKIDVGSYAAVTGKDRFTGPILELLRGLLHDDFSQRWTIDEMLSWMDGRRLSPKQSSKKVTAPRPLVFNSVKYHQPIVFAKDMHLNPQEVKRIVDDGELKNWVVRSLEKPDFYEKIEDAIREARGAGQAGYDDRLVSYLSMCMDNDGPIRFRGMNFHAEGVGSSLAKSYVQKEDLNIYGDIFLFSIVINWIKYQNGGNIDIGSIVSKFDHCRIFIRQKNIGFGLERCLYLLNPEARCLSLKLKDYYVLSPEDMMHAFEDMCVKGNVPSPFIDRHAAAFLSAKDAKVIDSCLVELNSGERHKIVKANLMCLAAIQKRSKLPLFPSIAKALSNQLDVVFKRYHDSTVREALQKNITRYAQEGDLVKMSALLENADVQNKDFSGFKKAMHEYNDLKNEGARLELRLEDKKNFGIATGQEASALISSIIAGLVILFVAFLYLTTETTNGLF